MQGAVASLPSRRLCPPSPWSLTSFRFSAKLPCLPAHASSKLHGCVTGARLPSLLTSFGPERAARLLATPLDGDAVSEESILPVIFQTETDQDEIAEQSIPVKFILQKHCRFGQRFNVVGSDPLFGSWDPLAGLPMKWSEGHVWTAELDVPLGKKIEFKFVLTGEQEEVEWQPGENHAFETAGRALPLVVCEQWGPIELEELEYEVPEEPDTAEPTDVAPPLAAVGAPVAELVGSPNGGENNGSEISDEFDEEGDGQHSFLDSGVDDASQAATSEVVSSPESASVVSAVKA